MEKQKLILGCLLLFLGVCMVAVILAEIFEWVWVKNVVASILVGGMTVAIFWGGGKLLEWW